MLQPIRPDSFTVRYLDVSSNLHVTSGFLEEDSIVAPTTGIKIQVLHEGDTIALVAHALEPVQLEACTMVFDHYFAADERIILNGYQTWTDTHELSPASRMRGLRYAPKSQVKRYVLDASGDYAFVDYDGGSGNLHGFTYGTFGTPEDMLLVASLDESHGFTLIRTYCDEGRIQLETECPTRMLSADESMELCRYLVTRGKEDQVFNRWFRLMDIQARPSLPAIGYTSWYRHYEKIDATKISSDLEATAATMAQIEAPGTTRIFQIDDGYAKVGDWLEPDLEKFPQGMAPFARRAEELGLVPGIWLAPFACEKDSKLFADHPDWLLLDSMGNPVATGSHWSGGYALDTLNPECRSYIIEVIHTLVHDWGFRMLKLDFLYAACMLPHGGLNRGQLMDDGVQLLREAAGDDCLLLGCGVPLAPAFGVFEYCRIGCDVGLDWDDRAYMRLLHRERVSTRNSRLDTIGRAPLDGRAFRNDPDVFFLRRDIQLTDDQKKLLLETDASCASMLLTSDDMSQWTDSDRAAYRSALKTMLARERDRMDLGQAIDAVITHALDTQIIQPGDERWAYNRILDTIGEQVPDEGSASSRQPSFYDALDHLAARAVQNGQAEDDEMASSAIMGAIMPPPSQVTATFNQLLEQDAQEATNYLHQLSVDSDYIKTRQTARNIKWETSTQWGDLEITINLSKPEKDPRAIAQAADSSSDIYPACQLCMENEGYAGRGPSSPLGTHPARQDLRIALLALGDETWGLQYSPYAYYDEHCIAMSEQHRPMRIDQACFTRLLELVDIFPNYFFGSNADLPIVGGSILSHDHFQGGLHVFPMDKAPDDVSVALKGFPKVTARTIRWPLSVIRLSGADPEELAAAATFILEEWRDYDDTRVGIVAWTDDIPHNTITPIARRRGKDYELDLTLRCNITDVHSPWGRFHPRVELHHLKKENIGLIEVMGLAILPPRLKRELAAVAKGLLEGADLSSDPLTAAHAAWALEVAERHLELDDSSVEQILRDEVGLAFAQVLEDAGVFKWDDAGRAAQTRFLERLS